MGCPRTSPRACERGVTSLRGPHAPNTVKRRLASWSALHHWKGIEGPFAAPSLRSAVRASSRPRERKSKRVVARDVLDRLIATCATDRLADTGDLAVLLLAVASRGRRGSEVARLRVEPLRDEPQAQLDPRDPQSPALPCLAIQLGGPRRALPTGRAGCFWSALRSRRCANGWSGRHQEGADLSAIDRGEAAEERALTLQSVSGIVKQGCDMAEREAEAFFAPGLRDGYLTRAARQGIGLPEAMQQPQRRSVQQAASYYTEAERAQGRAARFYDAAN
jgi:integrase